MKLEIAKSAGFCFGVERAVDKAVELAARHGGVDAYGALIHNRDMMSRLEKSGVRTIESLDDAQSHVIIRAHGVPPSVIDYLEGKGLSYTDATCPFVTKIHRIVEEYTAQGFNLLVAGDKSHPEIIGIVGHCKTTAFTANSPFEMENLLVRENILRENALICIAQTTFNSEKWIESKKIIKKLCTNAKIFDTICNATISRQSETQKLAQRCDLMIVVGGRESSNTKKLAEICEKYCRTKSVENKTQIGPDILEGLPLNGQIGITAGASTPAYIIKEVHERMDEIIKTADTAEESFEELFNQSNDKIRVYIGNRVKATVISVNKTEVVVDLGTKHSGYIPADELSNNPNVDPAEIVKKGDVIDVIVTQINDADGVVMLSKKKVDAAIGIEKIAKANEEGTTLEGVVTNVVKGGLIVSALGARVFIPASQSGVPRDGKLETLLKKTVQFKVIEINEARGRVVGSIKLANKEKDDALKAKFWESIAVGQKFTGEIKSIESYGVFVDLGGVDGMVHTSELTWERIRHPRDIVSVGDKIDVYVKSFDIERKRVSLGAKDPADNPWTKFVEEYNVGDVVEAKVVSITPFGAFAQIIPGVDGLIHISQIAREKVTNVGQVLTVGDEVKAKITEIDTEKVRVSLSIKALLGDEEEASDEEAASEEE